MANVRNSLIGRTVESVWIDSTKTGLKFVLATGEEVHWSTEGDCCSYSWVENITNLDFKGKVLNITDDGAGTGPKRVGYDYIQYYGCTVFTERGRLIIDYRNSSNGYYGGYIEVSRDPGPTAKWQEVE